MHINDQMIKLENNMEGLLKKIERQYLDITEKAKHEFRVKGNDGECNLFPYLLFKYYELIRWIR